MATVYLARLGGVAGFRRFVAIKRLHPHLARESEFVDMFLDEARLAARIHHPNVVPIVEIGESDQGYYLVMEYIEGDTAARLLARSTQSGYKLPIPVALRIVLDALTGLHAAHELKDDERRSLELVHRDVSPQNILVGVDGVTRLTDFGVARAASRLSSTRSGQLKGKLAYMAPEQARGAELDRRADIFAMGAVMWELLAAKRLFKGEGEAETLHRVLFEPIPSLRLYEPHVPRALEDICMRALSRDREHRFATAADMADLLEKTARSLQCLASARDVATYVDAIIGEEISQQREAVRAWLARSEPSRNDRVSVPQGPMSEEAPATEPYSGPSIEPRVGQAEGASTVTGVSSVIHGTGGSGSGPRPSSLPPRSQGDIAVPVMRRARRPAWPLVLPLALLGLVAAAFVYTRSASRVAASATAPASAAPMPAAPSQEPAASPQAAAPSPPSAPASSSASSSPSSSNGSADGDTTSPAVSVAASAAPPPSPRSGAWRPARPAGARPTGRTQPASPSTPEEPDDIAHNPYR